MVIKDYANLNVSNGYSYYLFCSASTSNERKIEEKNIRLKLLTQSIANTRWRHIINWHNVPLIPPPRDLTLIDIPSLSLGGISLTSTRNTLC